MSEPEAPDARADAASDYVAGFRDGVPAGFALGAARDTDRQRAAVEDAYQRGERAAAAFYSTSPAAPFTPSTRLLLLALIVVLAYLLLREHDDDTEGAPADDHMP